MRSELRLAQHGMGMQEATITNWLKKEGDSFVVGELLLEVEAAKTSVEIEAEANGKLVKIIAQPDDVVEVGGLLAELEIEEA
jgi:pyruvate/2-oxoglutarate dehydrogenase complex dihydrolipoamide acyltransferase (E2) component